MVGDQSIDIVTCFLIIFNLLLSEASLRHPQSFFLIMLYRYASCHFESWMNKPFEATYFSNVFTSLQALSLKEKRLKFFSEILCH